MIFAQISKYTIAERNSQTKSKQQIESRLSKTIKLL